jgi:hypothetical protein
MRGAGRPAPAFYLGNNMSEEEVDIKTYEKYFSAITRISIATPMGNPFKESCIWGANRLFSGGSGVGKSERTEAESARADLAYFDVLLAQHPPEDFSGAPMQSSTDETGVTIQCIIGAIRRLNKLRKGVLHLDEVGNAPKTTQGAALSLLLNRRVGDTDMAPKVRILLSTNPPKQTSTGTNLLPAFANRSGHWNIGPDFDAWCEYVENEELDAIVDKSSEDLEAIVKAGWPKHYAEVRSLKLRFMRANQGVFYDQPKTYNKKSGQAWPSPRTWDIAHRCVAAARCLGMPEHLEAVMVEGWVGEGPALDWVTFKANDDLPTAEEVLNNYGTSAAWAIDNDRLDRTFTVVRAVRMFVLSIRDPAQQIMMAEKAWRWLTDVEKEGHIDMAGPVAKDFADRNLGRGVDANLDKACEPLLMRVGKTGMFKYTVT